MTPMWVVHNSNGSEHFTFKRGEDKGWVLTMWQTVN